MNINDRLKEAFKNVAYSADRTWNNNFGSYQNANMGLYVRERRFQQETSKAETLKPRTVRDCIPTSKLAKYGNYEYGESREMSYSQAVTQFERLSEKFTEEPDKEPWTLEDVDDLFIGFLNYKDHISDTFSSQDEQENLQIKQVTFESLFLQSNTFDEMDLKFKIAGAKKLWEGSCYPFYWYQPMVIDKNLALFKSPTGSYFVKNEDDGTEKYSKHFGWYKNIPESENAFSHLKTLSKSFEEQNTWIIKKDHLNLGSDWLLTPHHQDHVDLATSKRLYSAVLQGTSSTISTKTNNVILFKNDLSSESTILGSLNTTSLDGDTYPSTTLLLGSTGCSSKCSASVVDQETATVPYSKVPTEQQIKKTVVASSAGVNVSAISTAGVYNTSLPINGVPIQTTSSVLAPTVSTSSYAATAATPSPSYVAGGYQQYFHNNNTFLNNRLYSNNLLHSTAAASTALRHNFIQNTFSFPPSSFPQPPMVPSGICSIPSYHHASSVPFQRTAPAIAVPSMYSRATGINAQRPLQIHAAPLVVPASNWFVPNNQQMQYFSDKFRRFRATTQPSTSGAANSTSLFQYKQNSVINSSVNNRSFNEGINRLDCTNAKIVKKEPPLVRCLPTNLAVSVQRTSVANVANNSVSTNTVDSRSIAIAEDNTSTTSKDFERVVTKTVNVVLEDSDTFVPVTSSQSDELEIQALEQYHNSSDNVYQELERLAAEQYDGNTTNDGSENLHGPPNHDHKGIFGGLVINIRSILMMRLAVD